MTTYSITIRPATLDELERCEVTDMANLTDGSFAVLRDGGLVALSNEYGTVVWPVEDSDKRERFERLIEVVQEVW